MAELKQLMEFQRNFDNKHGWDYRDPKKFMDNLQYGSIALAGEVGELANFVKKVLRARKSEKEPEQHLFDAMRVELIDVFIYVLIMADVLGVELESGYFTKMRQNELKFKQFENQTP